MSSSESTFVMAYFRSEAEVDGEQVRFALSEPGDPTRWIPLAGGAPILRSDVGELGARDPFLVRDPDSGRVRVLATNLRVHDGDWDRTVRHGSGEIVVWDTDDFRAWSGPRLARVAGADAGNVWAPKAFWSADRGAFLMLWASALYAATDRAVATYQRVLAAYTTDFVHFTDRHTYLDPGHDVLDATLVEHAGRWYRLSANAGAATVAENALLLMEVGRSMSDPEFAVVRTRVGSPHLAHGEGPAVFFDSAAGVHYLLIDEFGIRGYQLFRTRDLAAGEWEYVPEAVLPPGARHGSVLEISAVERRALLMTWGDRPPG